MVNAPLHELFAYIAMRNMDLLTDLILMMVYSSTLLLAEDGKYIASKLISLLMRMAVPPPLEAAPLPFLTRL